MATVIVREHRRSPNGRWCLWCGANCDEGGDFGDRATCNPRDDGQDVNALRPEPKRREFAVNDSDTINRRMAEIRVAEMPMCPNDSSRTLHSCLRSSQKCGDSCPFCNDWIGPQ